MYSNIHEGTWYPGEGASNESGVVENGKFQRFCWLFSYTLDMRPALLYGDMQSVVAFPVTPKYVTLNNLNWLFRVKFCFRTSVAG